MAIDDAAGPNDDATRGEVLRGEVLRGEVSAAAQRGAPADDRGVDACASPAAHLLEVAFGRAEPRSFWADVALDDQRTASARPTSRRSATRRPRPIARRSRPVSLPQPTMRRFVAGALIALVVGLGTVGVLRSIGPGPTRSGSAGVAETPSGATGSRGREVTAAMPTSEGSRPDRAAVPGWLDETLRARCRQAPGLDPESGTAWVCAPLVGPARLELVVVDRADHDALHLRFATASGAATSASSGRVRESQCALGSAEVRAWSSPDRPGEVVGHYACRVVAHRAEIVWIDERLGLFARAVADDRDLVALYRWWSTDAPGAESDGWPRDDRP